MTKSSKGRRISGQALVLCIFLVDAALAQQSRVFATSTLHDGNLGGLAGADAICEQRATAAGLGGGPWVAWLSTNGPGAIHARDRLAPGSGPFVRAAQPSVVIANDISDLTDGTLQNAIALDESGSAPAVVSGVKTGTKQDGTAESFTCDGWTIAGSGVQTIGLMVAVDSSWTEWFPFGCGILSRIYCFEAPVAVPALDLLELCMLALLLATYGWALLVSFRKENGHGSLTRK